LRHTDLKVRFYEYLTQIGNDQQVIMIENTDPPDDVRLLPYAQKYLLEIPRKAARAFSL
jgi:hypothetical protein